MRAKLLAALAIACASSVARADGYRAVVDRAELEPAAITGYRLRVFFSAETLGGQQLDLGDARAVHVLAGTTDLKAPYALGRFAATSAPIAVVVIVEVSGPYSDVVPIISDALDRQVLAALPEQAARVAVLPYGEATGNGKLGTLKAARARATSLAGDGSVEDPAMLDTVERALILLRKASATTITASDGADPVTPRELRKIIIVIGDGRDRTTDRDRVTHLGQRAAKEGVRIHTLGYSPTDTRRPLLALGELSKRSLGTFRWVRGARDDSWTPAMQQLRDEISGQYVATFFVPDGSIGGHKVKIQTTGRVETTSNEVKVPEGTCGGQTCDADGYCAADRCVIPSNAGGRGILGWLFLIGVITVGVLFALGLLGYVMMRRDKAAAGPKPATPAPPPAKLPLKPPSIAPVPIAAPVPAPTRLPNGKPAPVLYVMTGDRASQRVTLRHGFTIGKAPTCDFVIDDGYTSGVHAQIGMDTFGNCRLYDNQSTNGIFVNGVRVSEYALQHGVTMRIGSTELRFLAE